MKMKKFFSLFMTLVMAGTLSSCGKHFHHYEFVASRQEPTCTAEGHLEHFTCSECNELFILENGEFKQVTEAELVLAKLPHTLLHHDAVSATYTAAGNIEYWTCSVCGGKFGDAQGTRALTDAQIIVAKLSEDEIVDYFTLLNESDELFDYKSYICYDLLENLNVVLDAKESLAEGVLANVLDEYIVGINAIARGLSVAEIMASFKEAKTNMMECIPLANGVYNFTQYSKAERTRLTGIVENFIARTFLGGITLYESGSYVMYNERITLGTETYIPSYGFGALAEGSINADLESESNPNWKRYYHTYESSNPNTVLYWNDQGAQVSDLFAYLGASYFETFMAPTKDSYIWVGSLSKDDRPVAVNPDADGNATQWKIAIRTGADGLKYNTLSSVANRAAFNNREVAAADYLTPYMILLNQHNGLFRGGEAAANCAKGNHILGLDDYYNATANTTALFDADLFKQYVKLDVVEENGQWYLTWTNSEKTSAFDAMYYISSSLFSPIPAEFVELVGLDAYCGFNNDKTTTPVDNTLSLGAYTLEAWDDQTIVYKKNPNYVFADTKYSAPGIHFHILEAIQTDEDAAIKEFLAGKIDAAGLPKNYLTAEYLNDPRTRRAVSGSNFKLNVNACDEETWLYYFGENGTVVETKEKDYWKLSPLMSNRHFLRGLSYALDRGLIAEKFGVVPEVSYLGSAYMADAEAGLSYNSTQEHYHAIECLTKDTKDGYSLQLAREYFKLAIQELEAQGKLVPGTVENPTVLSIEIAWMYASMEATYHAIVKELWESAFNDDSVTGGKYEISFEFKNAGTDYTWVYYEKLMPGQFDIGFGSISGNTYNILDYMTVLSGDQSLSGGFTLSWGPNTASARDDLIIYEGERWSFDAILSAANSTTIVKNGQLAPSYVLNDEPTFTMNADGSMTVNVEVELNANDPQFVALDFVSFGDDIDGDYFEESVVNADGSNFSYVVENGVATITCVVSKAFVDKYLGGRYAGYIGFDIYFSYQSGTGENAIDFTPAYGYAGTVYAGPVA